MVGAPRVWLALVMLLAAFQTEPPEYPTGTFCTPHGDLVGHLQTTDHPCHCSRMYVSPEDGSGEHADCDTAPPSHDPQCKQWCHESHCSCPIACQPEEGR